MSNIAISYIRFSSTKQELGDSLRRQYDETVKYVTENNLVLDSTLSFRDLGVGAYDKANLEKGALGLFMQAVREGRVPQGATLIVESLDRLSRANVLSALNVFIEILNAGITIVTLMDRQKYSAEIVQQNVGMLMMSLGVMQRAHDESATKSKRVSAAWVNKKREAVASGKVMTRKTPHWIRALPDKTGFEFIPERKATALRMIEMAERGVGMHTIIKTLHTEGVESWALPKKDGTKPDWQRSYVQKFLTSPALYGAIDIDGDLLNGYYPPLIDRARWDALQHTRTDRFTAKGSSRKGNEVTNLFSGLLHCGWCNAKMGIAGYKSRKTGYDRKYVGCMGARTATTNCNMRIWFIDELEPTLLFWMSQVDYGKLLGTSKRGELEAAQEVLATTVERIKTLEQAINNGHAAIEAGVMSMIERVKQNEHDLLQAIKTRDEQQRLVHTLTSQEGQGSSRMKSVVLLFKALKHTTDDVQRRLLREQLSTAIHSVVEGIVLYPKTGAQKEERYIDIVFKNGAERRIEPGEC